MFESVGLLYRFQVVMYACSFLVRLTSNRVAQSLESSVSALQNQAVKVVHDIGLFSRNRTLQNE